MNLNCTNRLSRQCRKTRPIIKRHITTIFLLILITLLISSFAIVNSLSSAKSPEEAKAQVSLSSGFIASLDQPDSSISVNPQFNVQVAYVYATERTSHFISLNPIETQNGIPTLNAKSLYPTVIYLNFTAIPNVQVSSCDAILEVYSINLMANTGVSENYTYAEGTNYNPDFSNLTQLSSHVNDLPNAVSAPLYGSFIFNITAGQTYLGGRAGSYGVYTATPSTQGLWSAGQPTSIAITVQRIGWVIASGTQTYTIADSNDPIVARTQQNTTGSSFLFNGILPSSQLSQIDLFNPVPMNAMP
jgi:hypothetical protein